MNSITCPPRSSERVNNLTVSLKELAKSHPPLRAPLQQCFISLNKPYVFVWFMAFYYSYFSVESLSVNIIQGKVGSVCLGYGWGTLKTVRHFQ